MSATSEDVFQSVLSVAMGESATVVHDGYGGSLDMDVNIDSSDGDTTFEVGIWNLSSETWDLIKKGDPARIVLGWDRGPEEPVCFGEIAKKSTEEDGNDTRHIIKGKDQTTMQTKARISHTWRDQDPGNIVRGIASQLSLTPGRVDTVGQVLEGNWAIKKDEPVSYWLDQLVNEANSMTDTEWEWYCEAGRMFFEPKEKETVQATILSTDNTLMTINSSAGQGESDDESGELEFESLCEPRIKKGALVAVDHPDHQGIYKVNSYTFTSDTTTGDHNLSGTITPAGSQYQWSGYSAGGNRNQGQNTGSGEQA